MTPLDRVLSAWMQNPDAPDARLRVFEQFLSAELFLALEAEAIGDKIKPLIFDIQDGRFALVFDREDRLNAFLGGTRDLAAMSGRSLLQLLLGTDIGIGLNLSEEDACALFLPSDLRWCADFVTEPEANDQAIKAVTPIRDIPQDLLARLDRKFGTLEGYAEAAFLVSLEGANGEMHPTVLFLGAAKPAEAHIAKTISETLRLSQGEFSLNVGFITHDNPALERIAKHGLRFDLPQPEITQTLMTPGLDPQKPPRLR